MSKSCRSYPKLRFALITEDALKRLMPSSSSTAIGKNKLPTKEMYEIINATVNAILERKIRNLRLDKLDQLDKLDEIIENKVSEMQGIRRPRAGLSRQGDAGSSHQEVSIDTLSDFGHNSIRSDSAMFSSVNSAKTCDDSEIQKTLKKSELINATPMLRKSKARQAGGAIRKKGTTSKRSSNNMTQCAPPSRRPADVIAKYLKELDNQWAHKKMRGERKMIII